MKKIMLGSVLMISVSLISCGGNDSPEIDKTIMPAGSATPSANNTLTDSNKNVQILNAGGSTLPVLGATTGNPAAPLKTTGGGPGLNPAHGQPGHDCALAVGAPLKSGGASAPQPKIQTISSSPSPSPMVVTPTPTASTAPVNPNVKLNPAHGQPGHDCALAVGAPLKKN